MAKIPLRQYNREIESLIDRGQTEEAIAHCKHILQTYPKHIETYRLLGKAYLESQRYGEASDIFQRVLSTIPDDFVSQIGMSIIREDEGNLDAAIWHMERAYEVQPSNAAVQGELRRLYGRRDGLEPLKIRLTRGALVRMYARGDLYQQAIAEIRATQVEDPNRPDLQIILARMHAYAGQKVEAAEICSKLLNRLPYSFEANKILTEILPGTTRAEDTQVYQQRIIAMDPYLSFLAPGILDTADVPDNAIILDRLDWDPMQSSNLAQPQWAESLGIELDVDQSHQIPEWLTPEGSAPSASQPAFIEPGPVEVFDTPETLEFPSAARSDTDNVGWSMPTEMQAEPETAEDESIIPDWMKEAGWTPSTGEAEEPLSLLGQAESEVDIPTADIPDWLRDMAPADLNNQQTLAPETPDQAGTSTMGLFSDEEKTDSAFESPEGIPDWLNPILDTDQQPLSTPAGEIGTSAAPGEELPDWLQELKSTGQETQPGEWIDDQTLSEQTVSEGQQPVSEMAAPAEASTIMEPPAEAPAADALSIQEQDEALAWLESLAAKHGADEELLFTPPAERSETPPEWVQEQTVQGQQSTETPVEPVSTLEPEVSPTQEEAAPTDLPEWLQSIETPETAAAPGESPASHGEDIPTWLQELDSSTRGGEPAAPESAPAEPVPDWLAALQTPFETEKPGEAAPAAEIPDWIESLKPAGQAEPIQEPPQPASQEEIPSWLQAAESPEVTQPEASLTQEPPQTIQQPESFDTVVESPEARAAVPPAEPPAAGMPSLDDQDAALAWLESLAAKHGAEEELLFSRPEDRSDTPPEWVQEASSQLAQPAEDTPAAELTPSEEQPSGPSGPVAVFSTLELDSETQAVEQTGAETDQQWLEGLTEKTHRPEMETRVPDRDDLSVETPAWLRDEEQAEPELPSQADLVSPAAVWEPDPSLEAPAQPAEEIPAWLKDLKSGSQPEEPARPAEDLPAWLQEIGSEAPSAPSAAEEVAPGNKVEADLPDWLLSIDSTPVQETPPVETAPAQKETTQDLPSWLEDIASEPPDQAEEPGMIGQPSAEIEPTPSFETAFTPEPEMPYPAEPVMEKETSPAEEDRVEVETPLEEAAQMETQAPAGVPSAEMQEILAKAQSFLGNGDIERAVESYAVLVQSGEYLDVTIHDLREALYRFPIDVTIWEKLGDAYARANRLQEALDAYTKAEELLR